MKLRKKTLAMTLFSFAFACIVATSAYVLHQQGVFEQLANGDDLVTTPAATVEPVAGTGMYPVMDENNLWGFMDSKGEIILDCQYAQTELPLGSGVWVNDGNFWGMIDLEGNTLIEATFTELKKVSENGSTFYVAITNADTSDVHSSFYDTKGNKIFGISGELHALTNGLMPFSRIKDGVETWGYINTSGQIIAEPTYALVGAADEKYALVKDSSGQKYLLDLTTLLSTKITEDVAIGALGNGLILHENEDGMFGYLDTNQEKAIDYDFISAKAFTGGVAIVETQNGYGLIDTDGEFVVDAEYAYVENLKNGYYRMYVKEETASYIYNSKGELVTEEKVYEVGSWVDGSISIVTDTATRFIMADVGLLAHPVLEMQSGVSMVDNLYLITDDNGMTYFNDEIVIYSVGRESQFAQGINLHTITLNDDANYLVNYPEIEVDEDKVISSVDMNLWDDLNEDFLANVKGSYLTGLYDEDGDVNYHVNGYFKYTECGNTVSVIQTLAITDPWYNGLHTEYELSTICFDKYTGEQYLLSSLFNKDVDWRRELLEAAKVGYTAYSAGNGIAENPEILAFLEDALPYNVLFTLAIDSLTLYVPLSDGTYGIVPIYYQDFEQLINEDGNLWQDIKATEVDPTLK